MAYQRWTTSDFRINLISPRRFVRLLLGEEGVGKGNLVQPDWKLLIQSQISILLKAQVRCYLYSSWNSRIYISARGASQRVLLREVNCMLKEM